MQAEITQLYSSSICSVHNFLCRCEKCSPSSTEYQKDFVIAYIRKGNFQFNVFRDELDAYHGLFLINKPGYEYRVAHAHSIPDECTVFTIPPDSLESLRAHTSAFDWFFKDPDKQSILIRATPATEALHYSILRLLTTSKFPRLWVDNLIADLFIKVLSSDQSATQIPTLTVKQLKSYLPVIEKIKLYMSDNFVEDLSLSQLADIGNMSAFHFNRMFKKITGSAPYKYLLTVRLQLAQIQLKHTAHPITEVAFSSGFNSLEHFSASYKDYFGKPPSDERL